MKKLFTIITLAAATIFAANAAQSEFCETAVGHNVDENYNFDTASADSKVYMTIVNSGENKVTVTIKPHETNTKGVNYLAVVGFEASAGTPNTGEKQDELSVEVTFAAGTTTTDIIVQWGNPGWDGRWQYNVKNFDITSTCGTCELTEAPTMTSASLKEATSSSASFNVEGEDQNNEDITKFVIDINGAKTDVTAAEGVVSISGLLPDTDYTATIYAKDRCNNVSASGIQVQFKTSEAVTVCSANKGHFSTPNDFKISYEFEYSNGNLNITVTPYDNSKGLRLVEVQGPDITTTVLTVSSDKKSATGSIKVEADKQYAMFFLFGFDGSDANEMTAENVTDAKNLIYYKSGDCAKGTSAVEENEAEATVVWPNPASKYVNVVSGSVINRIDVLAQNGQIVKVVSPDSESATVDIAGLSVGRYIMVIDTEAGKEVKTVMVK